MCFPSRESFHRCVSTMIVRVYCEFVFYWKLCALLSMNELCVVKDLVKLKYYDKNIKCINLINIYLFVGIMENMKTI